MTDVVVDTPNNPEFLKQFARASMLHAPLDNTLKMFVRSFDGTTIEEALEYIGYQGAAKLRKRVAKLAREQLGEGEALTMILGFMKRCEEISERRNGTVELEQGRDDPLGGLAQIHGEAERYADDDRRDKSGGHPAYARQKMFEERRILEPVPGHCNELRRHRER